MRTMFGIAGELHMSRINIPAHGYTIPAQARRRQDLYANVRAIDRSRWSAPGQRRSGGQQFHVSSRRTLKKVHTHVVGFTDDCSDSAARFSSTQSTHNALCSWAHQDCHAEWGWTCPEAQVGISIRDTLYNTEAVPPQGEAWSCPPPSLALPKLCSGSGCPRRNVSSGGPHRWRK